MSDRIRRDSDKITPEELKELWAECDEAWEDSDFDDDCPYCEGSGCHECDGTGAYECQP